MSFLKLIAIMLAGLNGYLGCRFFLNVIGVLQTSKYGSAATLIYAILFMGLSAAAYVVLYKHGSVALSCWLGLAPWVISGIFLFINMLAGDYR